MPRGGSSPTDDDAAAPAYRIDDLPIAAMTTRDGVYLAVNRAFVSLTGWTQESLVGKTFAAMLDDVVVPRDRAALAQLVRNRGADSPRREGSIWYGARTPAGEERQVRVEWFLHENGRDALILFLDGRPEAFGREVTESLARIAGELSRAASEEEVLEHAVSALREQGFTATALLIDPSSPLLRYGPSATPARPTGAAMPDLPRPPREVLTRINPDFMKRRAAFFADGMRLVREAYPEPVAERVRALLPAERMVQAPLFLADEPYGALVVTSDALTPLVATALDLFAELVGKALEAVRLRRERVERERLAALGEAAGVMAHEVRNPVGAIMNAIALLRHDDGGTARQRELLGVISEEAERLEHLVAQLLELGRPLHPVPRAYALEEIAVRAARTLARRGGPDLAAIELPEGTTLAWLDADLAEVALVNVLRNAWQAAGAKGRIRVEVEATAEHAAWVVEDDGPGLDEREIDRLGEPFRTTRATGTGMGLAVVRRVLEASDGEITFGQAKLGGARVRLAFPRPRDDAQPG